MVSPRNVWRPATILGQRESGRKGSAAAAGAAGGQPQQGGGGGPAAGQPQGAPGIFPGYISTRYNLFGMLPGQYIITPSSANKGSAAAGGLPLVKNMWPANIQYIASPVLINEGGSTSLSGTFTDPGGLDTHTVSIDWGDGGNTSDLSLASGILSFGEVRHTYSNPRND